MLSQMLLLPAVFASPALAGAPTGPASGALVDSARVSEVAAGVDGQEAVVQARTRSPRTVPAAVVLTFSPLAGAPDLASAELRPTPSGPAEAMWKAEGLDFDGDAHSGAYPVEISLWDAAARPLAEVQLQLSADTPPCAEGSTGSWGSTGQARARLHLSPDGRKGTVEVGLSTTDAAQVAGVRVRFLRGAEGPKAQKAPAWAALAEVRQAWTATVPLSTAGAAYQVDAVVEDAAGRPFGRAHAAAVSLDGPVPLAAGACPWPTDGLAERATDGHRDLARR